MAAKSEVYKNQPIRSAVLRLVLVVQIVACAIVTGVVIAAGDGVLRMPDAWLTAYLATVHSLTYLPLAATLCLLFWIFRANKNATALSPQALENSPGWAVGWFFVPIAGLWKPYEVMREIYKASRSPHDWRTAKGAAVIGWWWGTNLLGNAAAIVTMIANNLRDQLPLRRSTVILYIAMIAHQLLLLVITGRIVKWQAAARRSGGIENVF